MDKNLTGQERILQEAEQVALAAWQSQRLTPGDQYRVLSGALNHEVTPLRTRRIADRLYRLNGRTGLMAWLDYLPFGRAFLKWTLPTDLQLTADGKGFQIPVGTSPDEALALPEEAANLARRALTNPEIEEVAVFTETSDPVLAVRTGNGDWYEVMRWE